MRFHAFTRRPPLPQRPRPPAVSRLVHYDPRSLARTETPLRPVAHQCARCSRLVGPDEAQRDLVGEWICADVAECNAQVARNERGGW